MLPGGRSFNSDCSNVVTTEQVAVLDRRAGAGVALQVPPRDAAALAAAIDRIWNEADLAARDWQQARPRVRVKLLPQEGETYVPIQSQDRIAKERGLTATFNPWEIQIFEWTDQGPVERKLSDFPRTELKTIYLTRKGEADLHLVNEPFDYDKHKV